MCSVGTWPTLTETCQDVAAKPTLSRPDKSSAAAGPRPGIGGVLALGCGVADRQRAERVDHHGVLIRARLADRRLDTARLRTVDESGRMERDRPDLDASAFARHELALRVEQHLVAVDVGMVVRRGARLRVVVEQPRHARTHDEAR